MVCWSSMRLSSGCDIMLLWMASELLRLPWELYECSWIETLWLLLVGLLKLDCVIALWPWVVFRTEKLLFACLPCTRRLSWVFAFSIQGLIGCLTSLTLGFCGNERAEADIWSSDGASIKLYRLLSSTVLGSSLSAEFEPWFTLEPPIRSENYFGLCIKRLPFIFILESLGGTAWGLDTGLSLVIDDAEVSGLSSDLCDETLPLASGKCASLLMYGLVNLAEVVVGMLLLLGIAVMMLFLFTVRRIFWWFADAKLTLLSWFENAAFRVNLEP